MTAKEGRPSTWWLTAATCWASLLGVAFVSAMSALPRNLVNQAMPREMTEVVRSVAPQGWSFFTRDARSPNFSAWRLEPAGSGTRATRLDVDQPSWAGLNRTKRVVDSQLMDLSGSLKGRWADCPTASVELAECLADARQAEATRLRLRAATSNFCGPLLLVREEPIPWGYRKLVTTGKRSVAPVYVDCGDGHDSAIH